MSRLRGLMTISDHESADLATPTGPMRTFAFRPTADGKYPGILLHSEIFQVTGPIRRTAAMLAGHGLLVAVPAIYHEYEAAGTADDTLDRIPELRGEMLMIWYRQYPHVPFEGRWKIHDAMEAAGVCHQWHEVNGAHPLHPRRGAALRSLARAAGLRAGAAKCIGRARRGRRDDRATRRRGGETRH